MHIIKDINGRDLVDTEEIKNRWNKYMEELYKKDPNEQNDGGGVVSHSEPDILEKEVKWALGSTAINKASGCNGIQVELFKILKDDAIKVLYSLCQKNLEDSAVATGLKKSILIPRRVVLRKVLTIG